MHFQLYESRSLSTLLFHSKYNVKITVEQFTYVRNRCPHNYEGRCIYIRSLLGYMFLHSYKDWECSTVELEDNKGKKYCYSTNQKNPSWPGLFTNIIEELNLGL